MSDMNNPEFYRLREQQERSLAESAINPSVREIHLQMAARYAELCSEAATLAARPRTTLRIRTAS